ncbi:DnaJ sub C member 8 [Coniosporium tulheliwenetii]|uniref:DnaJ sub C member 8 n=1 Tax=Coniosporium tulheliwenetii TaxID=3383036 RepID=A0ACC2ZJN0_9PEZI|nr:DnaJ sub C member 8 [Cladosporium sp. JES 115]
MADKQDSYDALAHEEASAAAADDTSTLDALEKEAKEFDKDAEIDRILKAFRLDAYAVLDLQPGVPESDIKAVYRKKSLLIHPDKTSNPAAPDAFDRLKKAQTELMDEKARERLDEAIADARMLLIRANKWTVDSPELKTAAFRKQWRDKTREVLVDNEVRRRKQVKAQMQEEGRAQKKEEAEIEERKRKRDHQEKWEETREQRIGSWRDFQKGKTGGVGGAGGGEKKKKKMKVLG